METFVAAKTFVTNLSYEIEKQRTILKLKKELKKGSIDLPIIELLKEFTKVPHCFTLQSCYGHFVHSKESGLHNITPLNKYAGISEKIHYRIGYMAFCIQNNDSGEQLFCDLENIRKIDSKYIQFGSAEWFWKGYVNSYVIQVEPERSKNTDSVWIDFDEALHIEKVKRKLFTELFAIALKHQHLADKSSTSDENLNL